MSNNIINNIINNYNNCLRILKNKKMIVKCFDLVKITHNNQVEISWKTKINNYKNISYDKSISTEEIRKTLLDDKQYCIQFYDGSVFSYEAIISKNKIIKSNILFIKCFDACNCEGELNWQDYQFDDDNDEQLGTPIYLRIDIDEVNKKKHHSICHLTLSNYKYCRIPIAYKISIQESLDFILNNFYGIFDLNLPKLGHERCIDDNENKKVHLEWNNN